jgi:hypothetical protein
MKLTAETRIASDRDTVWRLTQTPELHERWDLRFTGIEYLPRPAAGESQKFRYTTRIGFGLTIEGWGTTIDHAERTSSALRFGSDDSKSLIREGAGSWTYREEDGAIAFSTIYDYTTRHGEFGRVMDLAFRPLMIWATRWSFDRLRLWIEHGIQPEIAMRVWIVKVLARTALALIWLYEGLVPKILAQHASEVALVGDSGLHWGEPARALAALGVCEIAFGLWLLSGRAERSAAMISSAGVAVLALLVAAIRPEALADQFGGLSKNLALLACGCAVWMLSAYSPMASRARPARVRKLRQSAPPRDRTREPFVEALGGDLRDAAPLVRRHFDAPVGTYRYEGVMTRVWRVGGVRRALTSPFLWIGCWMHTLFPETGTEIPFAIVNRVHRGSDGVTRMTFERTFRFADDVRRFEATMHYDARSARLLDVLGRPGHLLVEIVPSIEASGMTLRSGRQWITPFGGPIRIPLPRMFAGEATIHEWQDSESSLGIRVTISNRLFGPFFGYEGRFHAVGVPR